MAAGYVAAGDDGVVRIESEQPEPAVPPVTTIAWRMAHGGEICLLRDLYRVQRPRLGAQHL